MEYSHYRRDWKGVWYLIDGTGKLGLNSVQCELMEVFFRWHLMAINGNWARAHEQISRETSRTPRRPAVPAEFHLESGARARPPPSASTRWNRETEIDGREWTSSWVLSCFYCFFLWRFRALFLVLVLDRPEMIAVVFPQRYHI